VREKKNRKGRYVEPLVLFKGNRVREKDTGRVGVVDMVITSRRYRLELPGTTEKPIRLVSQLELA
jgi:hypothetical protein